MNDLVQAIVETLNRVLFKHVIVVNGGTVFICIKDDNHKYGISSSGTSVGQIRATITFNDNVVISNNRLFDAKDEFIFPLVNYSDKLLLDGVRKILRVNDE